MSPVVVNLWDTVASPSWICSYHLLWDSDIQWHVWNQTYLTPTNWVQSFLFCASVQQWQKTDHRFLSVLSNNFWFVCVCLCVFLAARTRRDENALGLSLYLLALGWYWCERAGYMTQDGKLIISEWASGESRHSQLLFTLWAGRIHQKETLGPSENESYYVQSKTWLFSLERTHALWFWSFIDCLSENAENMNLAHIRGTEAWSIFSMCFLPHTNSVDVLAQHENGSILKLFTVEKVFLSHWTSHENLKAALCSFSNLNSCASLSCCGKNWHPLRGHSTPGRPGMGLYSFGSLLRTLWWDHTCLLPHSSGLSCSPSSRCVAGASLHGCTVLFILQQGSELASYNQLSSGQALAVKGGWTYGVLQHKWPDTLSVARFPGAAKMTLKQ